MQVAKGNAAQRMWHTRRGKQRGLQHHKRAKNSASKSSIRAQRQQQHLAERFLSGMHYIYPRHLPPEYITDSYVIKMQQETNGKLSSETNGRKIINPCIFGSIFAKLRLKCQSTARSIWRVRITFYLDSAQMMSSPALVCLSV